MTVLVTGGTGFIGSFVVEKLLEKGHKVCIVAIGRELPDYIKRIRDQITFHQADYGDVDSLNKILPGCDAVIHLAWSTIPKETRGTTGFEFSSNVINGITLLEKCIDFNIGKFVFISSGGTVYGIPSSIPISETHEQNPISGYGLSKLTMEKLLRIYHHAQGINYSVLRVSNAYGERQNYIKNQGVISVWIRNILKKGEIEIWGDGSVVRDYVYVKDVADAIVNALEQTTGSSIYNIGGGKGYSLNEILEELKKISSKPFTVKYKPARKFDVPVNILDITSAQKNLGYSPTTSLSDGIRKTYEWMASIES